SAYFGCHQVLFSPLTFLLRPTAWLRAISKYEAEITGGPHFAFDLCVRKGTAEEQASLALGSWRLPLNSASHLRAATRDHFAQRFAENGFRRDAFCPCYGLAEVTLAATAQERFTPVQTRRLSVDALARDSVVLAAEGERSAEFVGCGTAIRDVQVVIMD